MIQLLIVDDHPIVIDGIRTMLQEATDMQLAGAAQTASEALAWLQKNEVDVIILDISLPDMDGMDLCQKILQQKPGVKIIGLTTYEEVSFITRMLRNGAKGYLFKSSVQEEMLEAIRTVYEGETYLSQSVNQKLIAKAMYGSSQSTTFIPKLTRREKEVLDCIIDEMTTQEIADKLFLSPNTVETHRKHLISKLGVRNTAGLVSKAIKFGLA